MLRAHLSLPRNFCTQHGHGLRSRARAVAEVAQVREQSEIISAGVSQFW